MTNIHYGIIKGKLLSDLEKGEHPHIFLNLQNNSNNYKVAINIQDFDGSNIFFMLKESIRFNLYNGESPHLFTEDEVKEYGLDYCQSNIFSLEDFTEYTKEKIEKKLFSIFNTAINNDDYTIYAYGSLFPIFVGDFQRGIHDIHMNQGYPHYNHSNQYNDGAIFIKNNVLGNISGLFFRFKIQKCFTMKK